MRKHFSANRSWIWLLLGVLVASIWTSFSQRPPLVVAQHYPVSRSGDSLQPNCTGASNQSEGCYIKWTLVNYAANIFAYYKAENISNPKKCTVKCGEKYFGVISGTTYIFPHTEHKPCDELAFCYPGTLLDFDPTTVCCQLREFQPDHKCSLRITSNDNSNTSIEDYTGDPKNHCNVKNCEIVECKPVVEMDKMSFIANKTILHYTVTKDKTVCNISCGSEIYTIGKYDHKTDIQAFSLKRTNNIKFCIPLTCHNIQTEERQKNNLRCMTFSRLQNPLMRCYVKCGEKIESIIGNKRNKVCFDRKLRCRITMSCVRLFFSRSISSTKTSYSLINFNNPVQFCSISCVDRMRYISTSSYDVRYFDVIHDEGIDDTCQLVSCSPAITEHQYGDSVCLNLRTHEVEFHCLIGCDIYHRFNLTSSHAICIDTNMTKSCHVINCRKQSGQMNVEAIEQAIRVYNFSIQTTLMELTSPLCNHVIMSKSVICEMGCSEGESNLLYKNSDIDFHCKLLNCKIVASDKMDNSVKETSLHQLQQEHNGEEDRSIRGATGTNRGKNINKQGVTGTGREEGKDKQDTTGTNRGEDRNEQGAIRTDQGDDSVGTGNGDELAEAGDD